MGHHTWEQRGGCRSDITLSMSTGWHSNSESLLAKILGALIEKIIEQNPREPVHDRMRVSQVLAGSVIEKLPIGYAKRQIERTRNIQQLNK